MVKRRNGKPGHHQTDAMDEELMIGNIDLTKIDRRAYPLVAALPKERSFGIFDLAGVTRQPPSEVKRLVSEMVDQGVLERLNSDGYEKYQFTTDGFMLRESVLKLPSIVM